VTKSSNCFHVNYFTPTNAKHYHIIQFLLTKVLNFRLIGSIWNNVSFGKTLIQLQHMEFDVGLMYIWIIC